MDDALTEKGKKQGKVMDGLDKLIEQLVLV